MSATARPVVRALQDDFGEIEDIDCSNRHPVTFLDCRGPERRHRGGQQGHSYANPSQVELVVEVVDRLVDFRDKENVKSCAVLTPYNGQLDLLREAMADRHADLLAAGWLTLSTVDGFQGREADCVILTTVRSNDAGRLGFVQDPRRMNVAITRARRGLVVVGDEQVLRQDPLWNAWLDWLSERRRRSEVNQ